jgi:hypothetical protein
VWRATDLQGDKRLGKGGIDEKSFRLRRTLLSQIAVLQLECGTFASKPDIAQPQDEPGLGQKFLGGGRHGTRMEIRRTLSIRPGARSVPAAARNRQRRRGCSTHEHGANLCRQ